MGEAGSAPGCRLTTLCFSVLAPTGSADRRWTVASNDRPAAGVRGVATSGGGRPACKAGLGDCGVVNTRFHAAGRARSRSLQFMVSDGGGCADEFSCASRNSRAAYAGGSVRVIRPGKRRPARYNSDNRYIFAPPQYSRPGCRCGSDARGRRRRLRQFRVVRSVGGVADAGPAIQSPRLGTRDRRQRPLPQAKSSRLFGRSARLQLNHL